MRELFGDQKQRQFDNKAIIETVSDKSVDEITDVFNKVGFSSPPSWLKPYHVLSNGEKMRARFQEIMVFFCFVGNLV